MRSDDPAGWLDELSDDEPAPARDPARRRKLLLAAALPWLALPLLFLVASGADEDDPGDGAAEDAPDLGETAPGESGGGEAGGAGAGALVDGSSPEAGGEGTQPPSLSSPPEGSAPPGGSPPGGSPPGGSSPGGSPPAGGSAPAELDDEVAAVAEIAVRGQLTAHGDAPAYVDHARAEWAEEVGDLLVVRVAALVLTGDEDGWDTTRLHRLAIALEHDEDGALSPHGPPWDLAPPAPLPSAPDDAAVDFAAPEEPSPFADALAAAGYTDIGAIEVHRDPARPGLAQVRFEAALPPDSAAAREVLVAGDPPRVLGGASLPLDPPGAAEPGPAPDAPAAEDAAPGANESATPDD